MTARPGIARQAAGSRAADRWRWPRAARWLAVVVLAISAPAYTQPLPAAASAAVLTPEQVDFADQVSRALRAGRVDDARAALEAWDRDDAAQARAPSFQRAYWRGAVALTAAGRAQGGERDAGLAAADEAFRAALALRPGHDRVALGLASVARLQGDLPAAGRWHQLAAQVEGRRPEVAAFNALRYAEFLRDTGGGAQALTWSRRAVDLLPDGASAQTLHTQLLVEHGGALALARWLDERQRAGATIFAARSALQSLPRLAAEPLRARWSLVLVTVQSMARDAALTNAGPGVPMPLRDAFEAATTGDLAPILTQLRGQLEQARPDLATVPAWRSQERDPVTGLTPRTALRQLATTRARDRADPAVAERWWRLAVELGDQGPDPEAFVGLVAHLSAQGRVASALPELMQRYESRLFEQKGSAYSEANWALVFRMHMALGMAYGSLERWTSSDSPFRNAVFQLDAAMRAAERANTEWDPRRRPSEPLAVPAEGLLLLATGLQARGQGRQALEVQLEGAERLRVLGRQSDAATVVRELSGPNKSLLGMPAVADLPLPQRLRLERLQGLVQPR